MVAFARLVIIGFVVLSVVYICLSLYSKTVRRGKLETQWDDEGGPGTRDEFIRNGLEEYNRSLRRKLILGVYVVPALVVALIVYFTNFA